MNKGGRDKRFRLLTARADEMSEHYRRTLSPVVVEPLKPRNLISVEDKHFCVGTWSVWGGTCYSGMKVSLLDGGSDSIVLYLPVKGQMSIHTDGRELLSLPGVAMFVDFKRIDKLLLGTQRSHIGIAFDRSHLLGCLSAMTNRHDLRKFEFSPFIDLDHRKGRHLQLLADHLWRSLETSEEHRISPFFFTEYLTALSVFLLESVHHTHSNLVEHSPPPAPPWQVRRAIDFMTANASGKLTITDIATASGASVRSLQTAFQDYKQMSPISYLRQLRLESARQELLDEGNLLSIGEIARKWGFLQMSRFVASYHRAFGEPPVKRNQERPR